MHYCKIIISISIFFIGFSAYCQRIKNETPLLTKNTSVTSLYDKPKDEPEQFNLKGLTLYINTGVLFANKYNANFYNGQPSNVNTIEWVFKSPTYLDEIQNVLNISPNSADTFYVAEYSDMKYQPAFNVGLGIRYGFNDNWGGFIQFTQSTLKTVGTFLIYCDRNSVNPLAPKYITEKVAGVESRSIIDLGVNYAKPLQKHLHWIFEVGVSFNNIKVKKNEIFIEDRVYEIINRYGEGRPFDPSLIPNSEYIQTYIGYGGFFSTGLEFNFSKSAAFDLVYTAHLYKSSMEKYTAFKAHHTLSLRFLINRLFI